jgi:hypothetical protein
VGLGTEILRPRYLAETIGGAAMRIEGNDPRIVTRHHTLVDIGEPGMNLPPFLALASISREILSNAHHLPDADLMRIAGCLRTFADEVMAVIDRRHGARPTPRLVVDNTRR